jgi:hypothetical protein
LDKRYGLTVGPVSKAGKRQRLLRTFSGNLQRKRSAFKKLTKGVENSARKYRLSL